MLASMACRVRRARAIIPCSVFGNPCRRSRAPPRRSRTRSWCAAGQWLPRTRSRGRSTRRDSPAGSQTDLGRNRRRDRFCERVIGVHARAANIALFVLHRWLRAHFSVALTDRPRARSLPRRSAIVVASASSDIGVAVMTVFRWCAAAAGRPARTGHPGTTLRLASPRRRPGRRP